MFQRIYKEEFNSKHLINHIMKIIHHAMQRRINLLILKMQFSELEKKSYSILFRTNEKDDAYSSINKIKNRN